ncbi:hypothetical protein [Clostridium sp. DL1XJH146]
MLLFHNLVCHNGYFHFIHFFINIEELSNINIDVQIIRKKVIVTSRSGGVDAVTLIDNNEGKRLTGRKLII